MELEPVEGEGEGKDWDSRSSCESARSTMDVSASMVGSSIYAWVELAEEEEEEVVEEDEEDDEEEEDCDSIGSGGPARSTSEVSVSMGGSSISASSN